MKEKDHSNELDTTDKITLPLYKIKTNFLGSHDWIKLEEHDGIHNIDIIKEKCPEYVWKNRRFIYGFKSAEGFDLPRIEPSFKNATWK